MDVTADTLFICSVEKCFLFALEGHGQLLNVAGEMRVVRKNDM